MVLGGGVLLALPQSPEVVVERSTTGGGWTSPTCAFEHFQGFGKGAGMGAQSQPGWTMGSTDYLGLHLVEGYCDGAGGSRDPG